MIEPFKTLATNSTILLVEDNDDDAFLMRRAFHKAHLLNPLVRVRGGEEALAYLRGEGCYGNRTRFQMPFLLLLDLKMPRMDGFEVLRWVREQEELRQVLIVVLTSSTSEADINTAYDLGADSFLSKPANFEELVKLLSRLEGYWIITNVAPDLRSSRDLEFAQ